MCKFASDRHYMLEMIEDDQYGLPNKWNKIDHQKWVKQIATFDPPFEPRDYQYEAVTHAIERKRAVLISPTGSGKSLIAYLLVRWFLEEKESKVLIIVPTTALVEQMGGDFGTYGWDDEENVHKIYSGKEKVTDKRVIISTWQSLYKHPVEWFDQFGMVIGDEAHTMKAQSLQMLMTKCREAEYKIGMSGTLDGAVVHRLVIEGLFGPVHRVAWTKDLQEDGTLANLHIDMILLNYDDEEKKKVAPMTYQQELEFLVTHDARNKFIRNLALTQKGNTLILGQYIEKHLDVLNELIREKHKQVYYVHGGTDVADREAVRGIVEKSDGAIIIASVGVFSTGVNIRNIHNIIFASPSKSQIRVLQSIGRGLRKADNNQDTKLIDLADNLQLGSKGNYSLKHSAARLKIYDTEKFDYKLHEVYIWQDETELSNKLDS